MRGANDYPDWLSLPRPQVDPDDPAAGYLAAMNAADSEEMIAELHEAPDRTVEIELRLVAELIELNDFSAVEDALDRITAADRWEWRATWYRGLADLARGRYADSRASFTTVYRMFPGELAPKLALAMACESHGSFADAENWYEIVSRTDPAFTAATFGLARCRLAVGKRAGALAAYDRVPESSSAYLHAQTERIRCLTGNHGAGESTADELLEAGSILESLTLTAEQRARLQVDLLEAALALVERGDALDDGRGSLLGHPFMERDLRFGAERSYRELARWAASSSERIELVDRANQVRPRTWT
jgi:serine/threonine-protein kinase PknG